MAFDEDLREPPEKRKKREGSEKKAELARRLAAYRKKNGIADDTD